MALAPLNVPVGSGNVPDTQNPTGVGLGPAPSLGNVANTPTPQPKASTTPAPAPKAPTAPANNVVVAVKQIILGTGSSSWSVLL